MADPNTRWTIKLDEEREVRPVADHVVVKPLTPEERTKGGIYIPDTAEKHATVGVVVSAGPGRYSAAGILLPMPVKPGDTVAFGRYGGREVKRGDAETLLLMSVDDIQGILEKRAPGCPLCGVVDAEVTDTDGASLVKEAA